MKTQAGGEMHPEAQHMLSSCKKPQSLPQAWKEVPANAQSWISGLQKSQTAGFSGLSHLPGCWALAALSSGLVFTFMEELEEVLNYSPSTVLRGFDHIT